MATRLQFCYLLWLIFTAPTLSVAQKPLEVVELRYAAPVLLVQVRVNGSQPLPFAFDTGSTTSLIDARVARRLGIETSERPGAGGPGFARARTLAVGKAEARDLELVIRDLSSLSQHVGELVAGILGFNWMEQFGCEITYPPRTQPGRAGRGGTLRLWPRAVELTPAADQLPLPLELYSVPRFSGASLYVNGRLEGTHRCKFELDTGAETSVLGRHMAEQVGVDVSRKDARPGRGLATHRVVQLELAGRVFANVTFRVDLRRGADGNPYGQCVIGHRQLRAFVLTIDIPRRRAFFRSRSPQP